MEVIKGLNVSFLILKILNLNCFYFQIREGLFSNDDIKMLEGGLSVSDTDEEIGSVLNEYLYTGSNN